MKHIGRVLTAMITPFAADGSVDYQAAAEIAKYLVANGSDGLIVAGSTGEGAVMSEEEKLELFRVVAEAVPAGTTIVANTGSNDTAKSIAFTKAAAQLGVTACMAVVPYYNKPTQEGCYQHFKAIADAIDIPLIVYNVPGRTSSNIEPATVARLAKDCPNIVGIKEASGNLSQITEIVRLLPSDFMIYSGDDPLTLPMLAIGGCGVISVVGHVVGKDIQKMIEAFYAGDLRTAQELNARMLPLTKAMFAISNPIPIKEAMHLLGQPGGDFRLPLVHATEEEKEKIRKAMQEYGIL